MGRDELLARIWQALENQSVVLVAEHALELARQGLQGLIDEGDLKLESPIADVSRAIAESTDGLPYYINYTVDRLVDVGGPVRLEHVSQAVDSLILDAEDKAHFGHYAERIEAYYLFDEKAEELAFAILKILCHEADPMIEQDLWDRMPLVERTRMSFESERLMGRILGAASVAGLLLAALGLYGTMAFAIGRRTRELGIRTALGARPADVLTLVLGQGMRLALTGLALGGAAAFAATRTLSAYLYGVEARDPTTFAVVAALLVTVALAASYVPASRASRLDPSSALRHE